MNRLKRDFGVSGRFGDGNADQIPIMATGQRGLVNARIRILLLLDRPESMKILEGREFCLREKLVGDSAGPNPKHWDIGFRSEGTAIGNCRGTQRRRDPQA